jgi:aminoglycoside phosphotransferase family enzyme/predicted kinase
MTQLQQTNPLITALLRPGAYRHATTEITAIETHISWVLLTGDYVYKIKKPVNFGFLDFSTLEKRRFYCQEELRLNQRFCRDIYLEVVPINGSLSEPQINGDGSAIEYAVRMRQFTSGSLLSERAEQGLLDSNDIDGIAEAVSTFHQSALSAETGCEYGEPQVIRHWCEENFDHIAPQLEVTSAEMPQLARLRSWVASEWLQKADVLRRRKQQGFVRECHGDLHLGNIALIEGKITPFDCIEFNPMLRWIDLMSEIAFVLMDLDYRGFESFSWRLLNAYLQKTSDYPGLCILRYYLVYRALVRAKVALLSEQQSSDTAEQQHKHDEYTHHIALALRYTEQNRPLMLLTHGFSGSGKSFHAGRLAEEMGAIHLRSDIERKRLFGFTALDNTGSTAQAGIYTAESSARTYQHLADMTAIALQAGFHVIVDATFLQREQRDSFHQLAQHLAVTFKILDFTADVVTLQRRIEQRQQLQNDASEATVEILKRQLASAQAFEPDENEHIITVDTERSQAQTRLLEQITTLLQTAN